MSRNSLFRWWLLLLGVVAVVLQHTVGWPRIGRVLIEGVGAVAGMGWFVVRTVWPLLAVGLFTIWMQRGRPVALVDLLGRVPRRPLLLLGLVSIGILIVLVTVLAVLPPIFVPDGEIAEAHEVYRARNDVRTTLLQALAGVAVLLGGYFTYRQVQASRAQVELTRSGQVTERFNRAVDQLGQGGSDKLDIRLGGIFAFERIARDSPEDRAAVAEMLCAYLRKHAPWQPSQPEPRMAESSSGGLGTLQARSPDIQAIARVLGQGNFTENYSAQLELGNIDLRRAELAGATLLSVNLRGANLGRANLAGAKLARASMAGVDLRHADLTDADLTDANLNEADLRGAKLIRTNLNSAVLISAKLSGLDLRDNCSVGGANLARADLSNAKLAGLVFAQASLKNANLAAADLSQATLDGVDLTDAKLPGADLHEAKLRGARLPRVILSRANLKNSELANADLRGAELIKAMLHGANLLGADLSEANLKGAIRSLATKWPPKFDAQAGQVRMQTMLSIPRRRRRRIGSGSR